ncbi:MAG: TonB-dependent receptor [Cyanobacteria bacterium J06621_11]
MAKTVEMKLLLHSGVIGTLSALGLLAVAGEAQAQTAERVLGSVDDAVSADPQNIPNIYGLDSAEVSQNSNAVFSDAEPLNFPVHSDAMSLAATDVVVSEPAQAIVPSQVIAPSADFSLQPSNVVMMQPLLDEVIPSAPVVVPESVDSFIGTEVTGAIAPALTSPSPAERSAQENERLVTLALEKESVSNKQTIDDLPRPDWRQPNAGLVVALASDEDADDDEEDEEDEDARISRAEISLLAINTGEVDEEATAQRSNQRIELLALADLAEGELQSFSGKAPWLASSLTAEAEAEEDPVSEFAVPQIALTRFEHEADQTEDSEEDEDEENAENAEPLWLALADIDDDGAIAGTQKTPWLAFSGPLAEENEDETPESSIFRTSLLALNDDIAEGPKKRPGNWISVTPEGLAVPDNSLVGDALAALPTTTDAPAYDVNDLSLVAITPTYLANGEEGQVAVGSSEVEFLNPEEGAFLDIPSTSVVLRFPVGAKIALMANGQEIANDLVGRTATDSSTGQRTQTWYGVTLNPGENLLEVVSTETGEVLQTRSLVVRGKPESLVLLSPRNIPADGRSTSDIRGQIVDIDGNISLWNSVATLTASDGTFLGADHEPDAPGFQVQVQDGEFVAQLQSSLESHLVQLRAQVAGYEAFSQIQFVTPQRPSLLSGSVNLRYGARGTDFYDSYREFLPVDGDNRYELDVDAAVFATGNIGEWLYTGAYNSDRTLNENCQGESTLFGASGSNCNGYALYGDDSSSERIAPSLDSVYLRFERNSPSNPTGTDYALWGDFNTQEFSTAAQVFTSTSRQLHGLKAHYNFGNLAATALYANNIEGFQRDIIAPDGTSGTYFTSERNIVPGSETVFFELEELERPGSVLERTSLSRGADYEIDYDRGTLLFSDPVARTSVNSFGELLVRRIVTTYQHEDGRDTNVLAGRLQYDFGAQQNGAQQGQESWLGTSYFTENQGSRNFSLYGADAQISLGETATLTAEVARSSNEADLSDDDVSGSAYRIELDGSVGKFTGRAHFRTTDAGFSNAATTSFVPGQTRYGAQVSGTIGETTTIRAQYDHEDNFGVAPRLVTDVSPLLATLNNTEAGTSLDNSLTTYSVGVGQRFGKISADVDWIHRDRTDRNNNTLGRVSSSQLRSRLSYPIANNLSLVAQNEISLSSDVDPIYPSRTLIGVNWEALPWLNVGLNQIFYGGGGNNRGSSTSLDFTGEHTFSSDTTVRGRFSTIDGRQVGGSIGLEQGIILAPGLNLDLGYEKVFNTFGNQTAAGTQVSQSIVSGSNASALGLSGGESYSVGLSYTDSADFQGSTRFEHRRSSSGTNTVFSASAVGRLSPSLSVLGDYRLTNSANRGVRGLGSSSQLKLGLAYRNPKNDRWNALLRYEYRNNPNTLPTSASTGTSTETEEHLFATEAIYAPNWRWELYGKYALRNSSTAVSTAGNNFSSNRTVQLAQARATYRLGYRWDLVGEARWIAGGDYSETGYVLEAGYYPLPDLRLSAGYSGGATDSDFDNDRSAGGFYVGVSAKLGGLFSGFGTQPLNPRQGQESVIEVRNDASTASPTASTLELSDLRSDPPADLPSRGSGRRPLSSPIPTFDLSAFEKQKAVNEAPVNEEFPTAVEL